ncbi:MAG: FtsK/SpoIIIE domain-containing protein [Actinomycetota bacterium]|nr:FtsK/SpoIIIE domain-containing protein [Actinomycetota bacterium]
MRWYWTVVSSEPTGLLETRDLIVEADAEAPLAALAESLEVEVADLLPRAGIPTALRILDDGDRPMGAAAPLSGAAIVRGRPMTEPTAGPEQASITFRSGPLAGSTVPLERGLTAGVCYLIGRADDCDLRIGDPTLAAHHARLSVGADLRVTVSPVDEQARVHLDGTLVTSDGLPVPVGGSIELGASVIGVQPGSESGHEVAAKADLVRDGQGQLAYNRPSRIRPPRPAMFLRLPGPAPQGSEKAPLPWAMATIPIAMAGVIAFISGQPAMLIMSLASPVLVVSNFFTQRRSTSRRGQSALRRWRDERENAHRRLAELTGAVRAELLRDLPDPAEIRRICTLPGVRLWERRRTDSDALLLRVGVGEVLLPVRLEGGDPGAVPPEPAISPVPVSVDLASAGVLGIAGDPVIARALARWQLLQLAALRSPRDLRIVLLCGDNTAPDWQWLRWLPHIQGGSPQAPVIMIGNSTESRTQRVAELLRELDERREATRSDHSVEFAEQILLVIDGARRLRTINGLTRLLREGPAADLFAICIDDDRSRLPEEATAEVIVDAADPTLGRLEATRSASQSRLLLDLLTPALAEECARALAPIQHVGGEDDAAVLPGAVRFVDLLGVELEDPEWVTARWLLAGRSTRAVVGAGLDGQFSLDLKADGPHALVAGTTGAGKSEFLQTLVVSLAIANRPDALNFVLVDYKGASAFADCERLPHTVGMVTNLDNRETERALTSLDAELKRRETVLRSMGARDVDDAWDRDAGASARSGLARLVIVIDEFAELVHELPDFVTGLIRIARVGRSLGVHLVLATQRPTGVVSAEMQANVGLRVGLRMANKADSNEVLESPDAALISPATPGRGFARRGGGSVPSSFQTARVAGRRPGTHTEVAPPVNVYDIGWAELGQPLPRRAGTKAPEDPAATDLHALVELVAAAARQAGVASNPSPWLPALPARVTVAELSAAGGDSPDLSTAIPIGLQDLPAEQAQRPLTWDVVSAGHTIIAGGPGSGRSSVLRTIISGLANRFSPDDLHLYCMDFGPGALLAAAGLPHCGAVVSGTEQDRVDRLLSRLTAEVARRQVLLATRGLGDISELRGAAETPQDRLPYLVVVIDRWEGMLSAYSLEEMQGLRDRVIRLLREGPSVGLTLVIAGDRAVLSDRIAGFIATKYVLRLADREDYRLVNIRPQNLPENIAPGRAYFGDTPNEAQFALLGADPSGQAQIAVLRAEADALTERYGRQLIHRPFRVDVLPAVITLAEALRLPVAVAGEPAPFDVTVGVGGDDLGQYRTSFGAGPGFVIAGQRKTGRSTALALLAAGLHANGVELLVVCPKPSPLSELATELGVPVVTRMDGPDSTVGWIEQREQCAILIDDADQVHGSDLDSALIDVVRARAPGSIAFVVGAALDDLGSLLRGVAVEGKRNKQGLLLSPQSGMDGNVLGAGLPRNLLGRAPAGRGLMLVDGEWLAVQLPIPDGVSS